MDFSTVIKVILAAILAEPLGIGAAAGIAVLVSWYIENVLGRKEPSGK